MRLTVPFRDKLPANARTMLFTCVYGLGAAASAVAFQQGINFLYDHSYVLLAQRPPATFIVGSFVVIVVSSLIVGWLLNSFCAEASGSGIPQLKVAFWKDFGFVRWRVAWVKFLAGVVSIGGGASLGREGPSVQLAGGVASQLAGVLGEPKQNRRRAAAAGAAAGLAAAFNTPLAAITFVLEEIIEDLNSRFLGSVLLASVIGAFVVHGLVGKQPAFQLGRVETFSWPAYLLTPVVAGVASFVGVMFQKSTLGLRAQRKSFRRLPLWMRPALGGIITWAIGCGVFLLTGSLGVFSLGYHDLSMALTESFPLRLAAILLLTKFIATVACYGFGGCGGIFSPTLFLGGMCGVALAGLFGLALPFTTADQILLAAVGMSACLGAVVRAPVTGILIVFEMTHEFALVPALMVAALISQAISRRMTHHNFYEALLAQDGHQLEHVIPPRDLQSWMQMPVSAIANFHPVVIENLSTENIIELLRAHPYRFFPVLENSRPRGVVGRAEAENALRANTFPVVQRTPTTSPATSVADMQRLLIESSSGVVLLVDGRNDKLLGLVTLHDLLRAQAAYAKSNGAGDS